MRWPWQKKTELRGKPSEEATHSAQQARRSLLDVENLACRADDVADRLSRTRERNHFAAAIAQRFRGA